MEGTITEWVYPTRRSNNCKYLCPQLRTPKYTNQLIKNITTLIDNNTIVVEEFNQLSKEREGLFKTPILSIYVRNPEEFLW